MVLKLYVQVHYFLINMSFENFFALVLDQFVVQWQ